MTFNQETEPKVYTNDSTLLEVVDDFKYLGSWVNDITIRKALAWNGMGKVWRSPISPKLKLRFFGATVEIVGVEDPALNLIFLIIKKYIIYVRSYKLPFVPQVVVNQILQRICSDKGNLSDRLFCNKWNSFLDMVKLAERYRKSFNVCV